MFSVHAKRSGKRLPGPLICVCPSPKCSQDAGRILMTVKRAAEFGPLCIKTALNSGVQLNYSNTRQMGLPKLSHNT